MSSSLPSGIEQIDLPGGVEIWKGAGANHGARLTFIFNIEKEKDEPAQSYRD